MLVKASTLLAGMILNGEYQSVKGEWSMFIQGTVHTGILQYVALMYTYSSGDPYRILLLYRVCWTATVLEYLLGKYHSSLAALGNSIQKSPSIHLFLVAQQRPSH